MSNLTRPAPFPGGLRPARLHFAAMPANPYRVADDRQRAARRREHGLGPRIAALAPLAGAIGAVWLAGDLYATLLPPGESSWIAGFSAIASRAGLVVAALLSLSTYDTVVRGPDRGIVDLHPLLPAAWLRARTELVVRERAWWLVVGAVFLAPLYPRLDALLLGFLVLFGGWAAGIGAGLGVNLVAPSLAGRPALAGLFDAIRGPNPRLQAALLYAPGVALTIAGAATLAASWGASEVLMGRNAGAVGLLAPFVVAAAGLALASRAAPSIAGIGAVLGEIEGAWARADAAEDAHTVYLEWTVRLAPASLRLGLRKDLRHLWRAHRGWITGSWGLGLLAATSGWTDAADGPDRLARVGAAALGAFGLVGVRLGAADPKWLDDMLPLPGRRAARATALFACMQVVVLMGGASLFVRQGVLALPTVARLEAGALVLAVVAAWAGDALRGRGGLVYLPVALLVWSLGGAS